MTLLSVAELKQHLPTSIDAEALERELEAAEDAIDNRVGKLAERTERIIGGNAVLIASAPIGEVVSVTEDGVLLESDDYRASGYLLRRLDDGTNPRTFWRKTVLVYVPADDYAERVRVQVALVQLALNHEPGLSSQSMGPFAESYSPDYEAAREQILATLERPVSLTFVGARP